LLDELDAVATPLHEVARWASVLHREEKSNMKQLDITASRSIPATAVVAAAAR
jgi:hypothetical protein